MGISSDVVNEKDRNAEEDSVTRAETLARTCIADSLNSRVPAEANQLITQFIAHASNLIGIAYKWYGDPDNERSTWSRMQGKIHRWMLANRGQTMERRIGPWIRLFANEPPDSPINSTALLEQINQMAESEQPVYHDEYTVASNLAIGYRVVFRTSTGLLGLGPIDLTIGDEVWVLVGARTPVVLRRKKASSKKSAGICNREHLGTAYVHGMMDGEILRQDVTIEDIILE